MLILIGMENKLNAILNEIIELLEFSQEDLMKVTKEDETYIILDLVRANQIMNWFLQNTEARLKIKKANGDDLIRFEGVDGFREFLIRHIGVKEGEKWVIEQSADDKFIALRRALPNEIRAYNAREDVIEIEADKVLRIMSIGKDIGIEEIDFKYAIQYL